MCTFSLKIQSLYELLNYVMGINYFCDYIAKLNKKFDKKESLPKWCNFNNCVRGKKLARLARNFKLPFLLDSTLVLDKYFLLVTKVAYIKSWPHFFQIFSVRLKQNRYPVLLLTQGINSKYDDYVDPRTWTIKNGSNFVGMISHKMSIVTIFDRFWPQARRVWLF